MNNNQGRHRSKTDLETAQLLPPRRRTRECPLAAGWVEANRAGATGAGASGAGGRVYGRGQHLRTYSDTVVHGWIERLNGIDSTFTVLQNTLIHWPVAFFINTAIRIDGQSLSFWLIYSPSQGSAEDTASTRDYSTVHWVFGPSHLAFTTNKD